MQIMTVAETARRLELTPAAVRHLANTGKLLALRTQTGVRFFNSRDVERFARERAALRRGGD